MGCYTNKAKCFVLFLAFLYLCVYSYSACVEFTPGNFVCDYDEGEPGIFSDSISADTLEKTGGGTVYFTGVNNVTLTTLSSGDIFLSSQNNLTGAVTTQGGFLASGDTLTLNNNISVNGGGFNVSYSGAETDEGLTLTGSLTGTSFDKKGGGVLNLYTSNRYTGAANILEGGIVTDTNSFGGSVVISQGENNFFVLAQNADGVFGGQVSGAGDFIKDGTGVVTLAPGAGISGVTTNIYEGALSISEDSHITGDIDMLGGEIIVTGNVTFGALGPQHIYLDNDLTSIEKTFTVDAGAELNISSNATISGSGFLVKDGAGKLFLDHNYNEENYSGNTVLKDGILEIKDGGVLGSSDSILMLRGGEFIVSGSTVIDRVIAVQTNNTSFNVTSGNEVELTQNIRGAGKFVKEGSGILTMLEGTMVHSGGTVINGGVLQGKASSLAGNIENNSILNFLQDTDDIFNGVLSGLGTVNKKGEGVLTLSGVHTFDGVYNVLEGSLKGTASNITADAVVSAGSSVIFETYTDGEYSKSMSGGGSLVKQGAGILKLSGVNTYSGGTVIKDAEGILFEDDSSLGASGGKIILEGGNISLNENIILSSARNFELGQGPNYITSLNGAEYTISGSLSGSSFVKLGTGTLVLTGVNTHTGGTQISEGVLAASSAGALGSGMLAVTGGTFKALSDIEFENNIYINGLAGFDVDSGAVFKTAGYLYGGGTINKKGAGTLELGLYNSYTGGLDIEEGVVAGNSDSILGDIKMSGLSQLNFNQDYDGYYYGNIDAAAGTEINKTGLGLLIMEGDADNGNLLNTGSFNINQGSVLTLGKLKGNVNVASGAELFLSNSGGGIFNIDGTLYIDSTKNIDLEGDLKINNGGVITAEIIDGKDNKLNIKNDVSGTGDGSLYIDASGNLNIVASGVFASQQSFEIIDYEGTLNGVFGAVNVINNSRLNAVADYHVNGVISVLIQRILSNYFGLNGLNYNQKQMAKALDRASASPSADFEDFLNAIDNLPGSSRAEAITQSGGFIYANIFNVTSFRNLRDNAYLRFDQNKEGELTDNIWARATGNYTDIKANKNSENLYNFSSGFVFGLDKYNAGLDLRAGMVSSYTRHDLKHNSKENLDSDEYMLGAYILMDRGVFDFKSTLAAGYATGDVRRDLSFASREARAKTRLISFNLDIEIGAEIASLGSFKIRPFAGADASVIKRNSFNEKNAGDAGLAFEGDTVFASNARGGIGIQNRGKRYFAYLDALVKQNLSNPDTELVIFNQKYNLKAAEIKTSYGFKAGCVRYFSDLISVFADGGADLNGDMKNLYLSLGVRSYW